MDAVIDVYTSLQVFSPLLLVGNDTVLNMIENFKGRFLPERKVLGGVQFSFERGRG